MPYLMIKVFNNTLTNDIVSFEQLGPGVFLNTSIGSKMDLLYSI